MCRCINHCSPMPNMQIIGSFKSKVAKTQISGEVVRKTSTTISQLIFFFSNTNHNDRCAGTKVAVTRSWFALLTCRANIIQCLRCYQEMNVARRNKKPNMSCYVRSKACNADYSAWEIKLVYQISIEGVNGVTFRRRSISNTDSKHIRSLMTGSKHCKNRKNTVNLHKDGL